jgi:hypothetical protein
MLKADGYKDTEIIGNVNKGIPSMLPTLKTTPTNFDANYKSHILPAITAFMRGAQTYVKHHYHSKLRKKDEPASAFAR